VQPGLLSRLRRSDGVGLVLRPLRGVPDRAAAAHVSSL